MSKHFKNIKENILNLELKKNEIKKGITQTCCTLPTPFKINASREVNKEISGLYLTNLYEGRSTGLTLLNHYKYNKTN